MKREFARVSVCDESTDEFFEIFGDGIQAPSDYRVEFWDGKQWKSVEGMKRISLQPTGGQFNEATFRPVDAAKVRIVFVHNGRARSGVSEIYIWRE